MNSSFTKENKNILFKVILLGESGKKHKQL